MTSKFVKYIFFIRSGFGQKRSIRIIGLQCVTTSSYTKVYLNFRLVQHYEYLAKIIPYCEEIIPKIIPPHLVIINPIVPVLCSIGDWFVLYQMSRNMNRYNTILKNLYYFLAVRFPRISEPVISEVFPDFLTSLISRQFRQMQIF